MKDSSYTKIDIGGKKIFVEAPEEAIKAEVKENLPPKETEPFDKVKYNSTFNKSHYDRIETKVPKGKKAIITEYARSKGLSLNGYINKLIAEDMGESSND